MGTKHVHIASKTLIHIKLNKYILKTKEHRLKQQQSQYVNEVPEDILHRRDKEWKSEEKMNFPIVSNIILNSL